MGSCNEPAPSFPAGTLARLKTAASAEEFFVLLAVPYENKVLNVARLHILKRMGEYLDGDDLDGAPEAVALARCRAVLARAYEEFAASSPLDRRVFKVLKDAVAPKRPAGFVPLDDLK
ncbi:nitrogenase stabilizing/protective protein NifW [Rhodoplanes serenus]|uniref:nitrogenase stabilizing/protective protein NifW n=1 Tax=Rhodoplanes serenus TaxID=200615 RepID=UPI000DAE5B5C|nr:nitrogenase stabilizing/protective protein NifW [Rhodoplanes serenus]RAI35546.1 nitrogenase stabilizing/protective protein NifW [Rhodoplanes serenus]